MKLINIKKVKVWNNENISIFNRFLLGNPICPLGYNLKLDAHPLNETLRPLDNSVSWCTVKGRCQTWAYGKVEVYGHIKKIQADILLFSKDIRI